MQKPHQCFARYRRLLIVPALSLTPSLNILGKNEPYFSSRLESLMVESNAIVPVGGDERREEGTERVVAIRRKKDKKQQCENECMLSMFGTHSLPQEYTSKDG